ncbi:hypothetical protein LOK49_LG12G01196 [Camellia lanceoleosa]|uniref:Uncharacterized protein n=1 Tax=Camellia lanceoleosa TaxID=1840588 RepID=A0ACC0FSK5_9ERIC|nr:hypothetical protein LOK49_LG12G01196 [Camellia lanceoleosa]
MAIAAVACWFSTISSRHTSRYSLSSSQRLFSTSHRPTTTRLFIPNASNRKKSIPNKSPPSPKPKSTPETEAISQKKFPGRSKDERPNSITYGNSGV